MKSILFYLILSVLLLVYSPLLAKNKTQNLATAKPNLVFILADDLGWADLPCYGNSFNEAPHLDNLAKAGMRFTNAYAACPVCSPTRASIQSGQYPARVGVIDFIPGHWRPFEEVTVPKNKTQYLPGEIETLAESLKKAGYSTGYFGKWHLGYSEETLPSAQGYDKSHVYLGGGFYQPRFIPEPENKINDRLSDVLTQMSIDFLSENKENPFFLFLAHYDVHVQLDGDKKLIDKYLQKKKTDNYPGNAVYAAMIEHLDNSVGKIVAKLKELHLEENTVVIFYSDNGGLISRFDKIPLLDKQSLPVYENSPLKYIATSNAPLRAEKGTVYEGGIREPLIIKWPGKIPANSENNSVVSSVDFYPTFLELAGVEKPKQILDGTSLIPQLLENKSITERAVFWHYPVYHHAVPMGAVRKGNWKLIENQVTGETSLYNLEVDISESTNLSTLYPEKKTALYHLLKQRQTEVGAAFTVPNTTFNPEKRHEWGVHPNRN